MHAQLLSWMRQLRPGAASTHIKPRARSRLSSTSMPTPMYALRLGWLLACPPLPCTGWCSIVLRAAYEGQGCTKRNRYRDFSWIPYHLCAPSQKLSWHIEMLMPCMVRYLSISVSWAMQIEVYTFTKPTGEVKMVQGKFWRPYQPNFLVSPPFPAYPSGHSTFGAACAQVGYPSNS